MWVLGSVAAPVCIIGLAPWQLYEFLYGRCQEARGLLRLHFCLALGPSRKCGSGRRGVGNWASAGSSACCGRGHQAVPSFFYLLNIVPSAVGVFCL